MGIGGKAPRTAGIADGPGTPALDRCDEAGPPASSGERPVRPARGRPRLSTAIWSASFRPFFLAASLYAPVLAVASAFAYLGDAAPWPGAAAALWHGHEMMFGFAGAVIAGLMLTALPSWAGTPEVRGRVLAALVGAWALGRLGYLADVLLPSENVPWWLLAAADAALFAGLCAVLAPQLLRARNRRFLAALPILFGLVAASIAFHTLLAAGRYDLAHTALVAAVYVVVVLYSLVGGVLTPIFTDAAVNGTRRGDIRVLKPGLAMTAAALAAAFGAADLLAPGSPAAGALALAAAAVHGWRLLRWQGWRAAGAPMVWAMHLGYAWLVAFLVLRGLPELVASVPRAAALHAFTVGALGMMMMGLMSRVALRHTGRALAAGRTMALAYALMATAPLLRLAAVGAEDPTPLMGLSALAWALPFVIYVGRFGRALLTPSWPALRVPRPPP